MRFLSALSCTTSNGFARRQYSGGRNDELIVPSNPLRSQQRSARIPPR
jgi:hypothetical protein